MKAMKNTRWADLIDVAVTVCDEQGVILEMNEKSKITAAKKGGGALIGQNVSLCHSPRSLALIYELIAEDRKNIYTIEKEGVRKLIYQTPWYENGKVAGLVELSLPIPDSMPHYKR